MTDTALITEVRCEIDLNSDGDVFCVREIHELEGGSFLFTHDVRIVPTGDPPALFETVTEIVKSCQNKSRELGLEWGSE